MYSLKTDLTMRRSVLHKTPNWLIDVPAQPGLNEALSELGIVGESGLQRGIDHDLVKKECCASAYFAWGFLEAALFPIRVAISISSLPLSLKPWRAILSS